MKDMLDAEQDLGRLRERRRDDAANERVQSLISELNSEANKRVQMRQETEERWIADLFQYNGEDYDEDEKRKTNRKSDQNRSRLFINLTRPKTNALAARLMDLLFPTDDRSWGIQPTPVPKMDQEEGALADDISKLQKTGQARSNVLEGPSPQEGEMPGELPQQQQMDIWDKALSDLQDLKNKAKRAADLMQAEIDDQLKAGNYQAHCRDAIEDACKLGTGILKGPVFTEKSHKKWRKDEMGDYQLKTLQDLRPCYLRVDPWSFFPDMTVCKIEDSAGEFERHLMTKQQLRRLQHRHDMDRNAIRRLLKMEPRDPLPSNMATLFSITGEEAHDIRNKYQVWEYTGSIEPEMLETLIDVFEDHELAQEYAELDPLMEIHAKIWFCQDEVLTFALHPLDSNECIYSVFNVERSETSVFGFGVPYIIRDPQASLTAAWRMIMDNAAISAGPQVVVNEDKIKPANNTSYTLEAFKVWKSRNGDNQSPAFEVHNITQNIPELERIILLSREMIDEMASMPSLAQGEQGSNITKTAQGMAILMNSANVVFRRMVKNWDDDMTTPNIRRMYDFNMQHAQKPEIKGDYEIDARGSSVLLVREIQSTNLMQMASLFADHPEYKHYIDKPALLEAIFKVNMLPSSGILRSEREAQKSIADEQNGGQEDPSVTIARMEIEHKETELDQKVAIAEMEADSRKYVVNVQREIALIRADADIDQKNRDRDLKGSIEAAKMEDKTEKDQREEAGKDRRMAVEVAMKDRTGESAGGSI